MNALDKRVLLREISRSMKIIFLQGENNKVPIFNGWDGEPFQPSPALPPQEKHCNGTNADASYWQQHEDHGGGLRIYVLPGKSLS